MSTGEIEEHILFRETDASGRSLKNWVTKYGGASGCLTIVVTENELLITFSLSSFPLFSLLSKRLRLYQEQAIMTQSDLYHRIPKKNIVSVAEKPRSWKKTYHVEYQDDAAIVHRLELIPKKYNEFEYALHLPIKVI